MELTRRDAVAALGAAGIAGAGAFALSSSDSSESDRGLADDDLETMVAAAEVLYPSAVDGVREFVESYVGGRAAADEDWADAVADVVAYLDDYADAWYDDSFASLSPDARDDALRRMGADAVSSEPDGGSVERVRYYVVNELLFALYASPTGGELVGLENPQGHPGGTESYRRGPPGPSE
ncbi:gluconate 2-dehydrogenase subunit 3 family protein [Halopiger aswanensis]|nr:gluconate 2-dehydrogenase subunit 3 family protein [Halopiger aswanensis]